MVVTVLGSGSYAEAVLDGDVLSILDRDIDLAAEQGDEQKIITIMQGNAYAATVTIPPKSYHKEQVIQEDQEGNEISLDEFVADEINTDAVIISLWPLQEQDDSNKESE